MKAVLCTSSYSNIQDHTKTYASFAIDHSKKILKGKAMKSGVHLNTSNMKNSKEEGSSAMVSLDRKIPSKWTSLPLTKSFQVTNLGLVADDSISLEEWQKIGEIVSKVNGTSAWWIGDWLRIGVEKKYGDLKKLADELPWKYQELRIFKYVAERIKLLSRNNNLSWNHHKCVAPLESDKQEYWLNLAEDKKWSVKTLRDEIKGSPEKTWLRYSDVWNFSACDERFGKEYPGRIPGQIIQNILYYWTSPGDLIVDPMAGGGVTLDVCKSMDRECIAFDIKPSRKDILACDATGEKWPFKNEADLIFIDPPYWSQMENDYGGMAAEGFDEFVEKMKKIFLNCYAHLKENGILSILISPMSIKGERYLDLPLIFSSALEALDFSAIKRVCVPVGSQQIGPQVVANCREKKIMLALLRDLIVFKKIKGRP